MDKASYDLPLEECNLCKSKKIFHFKTDYKGIAIYACKNCEVQFINPQYSEKYLEAVYKSNFPSEFGNIKYKKNEKLQELTHEFNISQIEDYREKGTFLSLSIGKGSEIEIASRRGWNAERYTTTFSKNENKGYSALRLLISDNYHLPYSEGYFHCVYLNHVLEHIKNPSQMLSEINRILKPGGVLYLACPNINSLSTKIKTTFEELGIKKQIGKYYDTWQHLFFYSPIPFKSLLENYYNFQVPFFSNDLRISNAESKIILPKNGSNYKSSFRMIAIKR